ncbi:MAG: hypothetical protein HFJ29_00440 [Clostridia bacterium]|nr:hypothetical protein [Clostridia bacterium]
MRQLLLEFKEMDHSILNLMKSGIKFSFCLSILSILVLLTYDFVYTIPFVYDIGFSLFKTSLFFIVGFVVFAFAFSKIQKEIKS